MADTNKFPNPEPPPAPGFGGQNPSNAALSPEPQPTVSPHVPAQEQLSTQDMQKFCKKGLPKPLLYILIFGVVVILFSFILILFRGGGSAKKVGTEGQITWWGLQNEESVVRPLIDEFQKQNPGVTITYVKQSPQDYRDRLANELASGRGPDIFEIHNSWTVMLKNDLAQAPSGVMSPEDFARSFYPIIVSDLSVNGNPTAVPIEYDALTLYINEDIFTSALKSPPTSWADLTSLAKDLTQRGPNRLIIQAGVSLGLTENINNWPEILGLMLYQNGVDMAKLQEKNVTDTIRFYLKFNKEDAVWDSTQPSAVNAFARGKLAMYFGTARDASQIIQENSSLRFRTIPIPQLPKERPTDPDFTYASYWAQGVWSRSVNSDTAWKFLKFISSPESLLALNQNRRAANLLEKAYPRPEMAAIHKDDRLLASLYVHAPYAKSWYLASDTNDGATGVNSQINSIFSSAIGVVLKNQDLSREVKTMPAKVNEVLAKYNMRR